MELSSIRTEPFWIEGWHIEPSLNRVTGSAGTEQLEPRVMAVLCCLAAHAGAVVARETLLETVWADVVVGDHPLNRAISTLRKLFGDDPRDPRYIETIRTVGYRLIAPVESKPQPMQDTAHLFVSPPSFSGDGIARPMLSPAKLWRTPSSRTLLIGTGILLFVGVVIVLALMTLGGAPDEPSAHEAVRRPMPLTSLAGREVDPALSPDGSRVAYAWDGGPGGSYGLYVRTLAEAPPLRLTDGTAVDRSPVWSRNGQAIAFIRRKDDTCAIMQMPALGGRARRLGSCMEAVDLAWSVDGLLTFADRTEPAAAYQIYLLDPQRGTPRPLTTPPASAVGDRHAGDRYPTFSPDGEQIAFVRSSVVGLDHIYTLPVAGGLPERRSDETQRIRNLAWPEPDILVYASDWGGVFSLYRRSLAAGTAQWIAGGGDGAHNPTVQDTRIVYEEWEWDKNVWAMPLGDGPSAELITSTRWDHSPHVASDGRVALISNRSGSYELWLWLPETDQAEALTDFGGPIVGRPRWHPDGKQIAFDVRAAGRSDIYLLDLNEGTPQRVTRGTAHTLNAAWSADGQWLYYTSDQSGRWEIWRQPVAGGTAEQVTQMGGYVPEASPDRRWLYYAKADLDGLWRQPIGGGPAQQVTSVLRSTDNRNWTITGDGLFLITRGVEADEDHEAAPILSHLDLKTSTLAEIARPARPVANLGLALTTDGYLLYVQVDRSTSDLMLIGE